MGGRPVGGGVGDLAESLAKSGAFPVPAGTRDVVEMKPFLSGSYTAQVTSSDGTPGAVLLGQPVEFDVTGANVIWYLDGVTRKRLGVLLTVPDPRWIVVGTDDFNADGAPDILWHDLVTGNNVVWYMDGVTRTGYRSLDQEADLTWKIVGTGDFNNDGKPDILWHNVATGANRVWIMDGVERTGLSWLEGEPDLMWTVAGAGDFNGDGTPDILWRNRVTGHVGTSATATVPWRARHSIRMTV